jgi:hypothetical protein
MSLGTMEPERGDNRRAEVEAERRQEKLDQSPEPEYGRMYMSDMPGVGLGEFALRELRGDTIHPRKLGQVGMQRAHIRIYHAGDSPPV